MREARRYALAALDFSSLADGIPLNYGRGRRKRLPLQVSPTSVCDLPEPSWGFRQPSPRDRWRNDESLAEIDKQCRTWSRASSCGLFSCGEIAWPSGDSSRGPASPLRLGNPFPPLRRLWASGHATMEAAPMFPRHHSHLAKALRPGVRPACGTLILGERIAATE